MRKTSHAILIALSAVGLVAAGAATTWAQSGSRTAPPPSVHRQAPARANPPVAEGSGRAAPAAQPAGATGSATRTAQKPTVALEGYCPVCLINLHKWIKGNPLYQVTYDGHVYRFPGEKQKQAFVANPTKYVPALGGDCVVCYTQMGKRMAGDLHHGMFHKGRVYFFASEQQKQMFAENPGKYENVDLALGGNCPVCKVEMNAVMAGNPDIAADYLGLRYLFPSEKMRDMFLANPDKYRVARP